MNLYGPDFYDDDALVAEIKAFTKARRELQLGGTVAVVAGEGRRLEFVRSNASTLDTELREMLYEARERGLSIGGEPGSAITVEFG